MILPHSLLLWLPGFHDKKDTSITYMFCIDFIIGTEQNFMGQQVSMVSAPYNFLRTPASRFFVNMAVT